MASSSIEEQPPPLPIGIVDCAISAKKYWALRDDKEYCEHVARHADPPSELEVLSLVESPTGAVTRVSKVKALRNPIPYLLRGTLGCKHGFACTATETWQRTAFDAQHRATMDLELPFLNNAIKIRAAVWVEAQGAASCRVYQELAISCSFKGAVGKTVAQQVSVMLTKAFKEQPARVSEWNALRAAAADADERASQLSEDIRTSQLTEHDEAEEGSGQADERETATVDVDAPRRLRIRQRWRMALMYVRFVRVLDQHRRAEHRLCQVRVDEPRTEGVRPWRYTSFRVCSRLRSESSGEWPTSWIESPARKRFSEFAALRAAIASFLPGIDLPTLPEKHVSHPLRRDVVASRRHGLQALLQATVDHPFAATSDDAASFLGWAPRQHEAAEEAVDLRAPLFARARACYATPPSRRRQSLEAAWRRTKLRERRATHRIPVHAPGSPPSGEDGEGGEDPTGTGVSATTQTDAMADALLHLAEDAAIVIQRAQRRFSGALQRKRKDPMVIILNKLESMEARLLRMEADRRVRTIPTRGLWDSFIGSVMCAWS